MAGHTFPAYRINGLGTRTLVTTSTAAVTLQLANDGTNPRYTRFMVEPNGVGASAWCYINVGVAGVTAALGNLLVTSNEAVVLNTRGMSYFACIVPAVATTAFITAIPLEDA